MPVSTEIDHYLASHFSPHIGQKEAYKVTGRFLSLMFRLCVAMMTRSRPVVMSMPVEIAVLLCASFIPSLTTSMQTHISVFQSAQDHADNQDDYEDQEIMIGMGVEMMHSVSP